MAGFLGATLGLGFFAGGGLLAGARRVGVLVRSSGSKVTYGTGMVTSIPFAIIHISFKSLPLARGAKWQ